MRKVKKFMIAAGAGMVVVGAVSGYVLARPASKVIGTEGYDVAAATAEQLGEVSGMRIFFAHQSVGGNILDATPALFERADVATPRIVESEDPSVVSGPTIVHTFVGRNRDPLGKIAEFDRIMRAGMADVVDVAVLKLCYIDVRDETDVEALFATYGDTLAALERDFPHVTFVHVTMPLTTEFGGPVERAKRRIKDLLGRDNLFVPADNVAREELNALIRAEYEASGRLFDIAAVQSAGADGQRLVRRHSGSEYFAMDDEISSDPGHLNDEGGLLVAGAFYAALAAAVG